MSNSLEGQLSIELTLGDGRNPASIAEAFALESHHGRYEANVLARLLESCAGGTTTGKLRVRVDSVTAKQASLLIAVTQANIAAGEYIDFASPAGRWRLTAVASGAANGDGTFNSITSDTVTAANIASAINSMPGLRDWFTATSASGNVTVTSKWYGTVGNSLSVVDGTVNGLSPAGGSLAGGLDPSSQVTATVVITHANVTDGDTLTIGKTALTWRAAPSGESEVLIGASATADGDNLVTKINAHSAFLGILTAANASGTVTITYQVPQRVALHIVLLTSDATAMALTQPASTLTLANQQTTRTYALGAP